jgi:PEGA domain-containing protein
MTPLSATAEQPEAPLFSDGIGDRVVAVDAATGDLLQILRVRPQLLAVPSFEFALRERAARLANFRHAYYARVRRIDRHPTGLAIVSDHVEGVRLSEILRVAHARGLQLDLNAALCLLRQLAPSIALLHENARDVAHGILATDRLIVTPRARLVVVEHVLGSAVEQLQFTRERLWQELHVAVPMSAGITRFDHRADVTAIGLIALALVLGRPIGDHEYPLRTGQLLNEARARMSGVPDMPLPDSLHNWIARALQLDPRQGFASATEAQAALEDALAEDSVFAAAPVSLEMFLSRYIAVMLEPTPPAPAPVARPIAPPTPNVIREFMDAPAAPVKPSFAPAPPVVQPSAGRAFESVVTPPKPVVEAPVVSAAKPVVEPPVAATAKPVVEPPKPSFAAAPPVIAPPAAAPFADAPVVLPAKPAVASPDLHASKPEFELFALTDAPKKWESNPSWVPDAKPAVDAAPPVADKLPEPVVSEKAKPESTPLAVSDAKKPAANPRDITELLRDFDLPPVAGAPDSRVETVEPEWSEPAPARQRFAGWRRYAVAGLAIVALAEGGVILARGLKKPAAPSMGSLSVTTNPPGVEVFVDGVSRGNTPARISLDAGSHIMEIRRGVPRVIPFTVTSGAEVAQYLELPETPSVGSLLVQSDPAGAKVTVDGVDHGVAPVSIADLAPGDHEVVLQAEGGPAVKQRVVIQAGVTSSVLAPVSTATAGPVSGWIAVKAPVTVDILEGGRLVGNSDTDKIMMAAGRHDVELVNETLGYRVTRTIQVPPGKTAPISIEFPQGVLNVNAAPWAEVWIDGKRAGETPIGNLPISIGPHEIVFRHPQLGEKRQAVSVTLKAPVRLSMDMK